MSDFDKEAEREKLREKYGDDADREATEQMSELLLKGATMTNAHCNDCGDPIFRFDGQEFCPTCQKPVDRNGNEAEAGEQRDDENIEVTTPSDDATVQFGGEGGDASAQTDEAHGGETTQNARAEQNAQSAGDTPAQTRGEQAGHAGQGGSTPEQRDVPPERRAPSVDPAATGDASATGTGQQSPSATPSADAGGQSPTSDHLTNAQVLLAQTVEQYAQRARDTDSPREAREYLEAAREAAETLDATGF